MRQFHTSTLFRLRSALWVTLALLATGCSVPADGETVRFRVPPGAGLRTVADTLAERDLIRWPQAFVLYGRYRDAAGSLKPGVYEVERGASWDALLDKIVRGDVVRMTITVPEGWTAAQIATRIAAATGENADSLIAFVLSEEAAERFEVPGPNLEGYLYPATYVLPEGTAADRVIRTMVGRYRQIWNDELRARADSIGLSEREVVTLASIVEKEARVWTERDTIAAVYLNRLRIGMRLEADPTVQYALGQHQQRLLFRHIDEVADHPYNTYRQRGIPPGPIASPSVGSIRAVLYPADVRYLFFRARSDGTHVFTRTFQEHIAAGQRIRREAAAQARQQQQQPPAPGTADQ
jgi:UPF0755 protein